VPRRLVRVPGQHYLAGRHARHRDERHAAGVMAVAAAAGHCIDAAFQFAANHHNPIEALTTMAAWDGDQLTIYDSCRGIKAVQLTVAALLGLSLSQVRVVTRYVGGAFGCKAMVWPHVTLTALAAQHVRRPAGPAAAGVRAAATRSRCWPPPPGRVR
jgi:CO/xanthine dehydrogenase Mo-binding subunit